MEIFKLLLVAHIIGGGISLLLGLYIMLAKKGNRLHKRIGSIYFYSMLLAAVVAIPMCYLHPNYFLFLISIFTIYILITGVRYLKKKKVKNVKPLDWLLTIVMLIFSVAFVAFGIFNIVNGEYFGTVFLVFGSIGLFFSWQDYINFKGKSNIKNYFLTTHLQRMVGSYIASTTAFLVVNNKILPSILAWLLPTITLVPLIVRWTRKYKMLIKNRP